MIEILKEETLEEKEKRKLTEKKQTVSEKQGRKKEQKKEYKKSDRELQIPKNIRQVGDAGEDIKVYFEDYVMTYIKQQAALGKEKEEILILYGDKRKIYGRTYYFVSGAMKGEDVNSCLYPILFNQEDWKKINEMAAEFFSGLSVLGWALLCEDKELGLEQRIVETHQEFFSENQPVFLEYSKADKEEKIFIYQGGEMLHQPGHYIYYDRNEKMQNYMIKEKDNIDKVEEESVDHAARQFRMVVQAKQEEKRRKRTSFLLYSTAIVLAMVVILIGITLLGNYEKMDNMEKVLYQMVDHTNENGEQMDNMEEKLDAMEVNKSIASSEMSQVENNELDNIKSNQETVAQETIQQAVDVETIQTDSNTADMQIPEKQIIDDGSTEIVINTDSNQNENAKTEILPSENVETDQTPEPASDQNETVEKKQDEEKNSTQSAESNDETDDIQTDDAKTDDAKAVDAEADNAQTVDAKTDDAKKDDAKTDDAETDEGQAAANQVYEIQKGDTLEKINRKFFGNENRIKEICQLNHIENQDNICYGEKIILPQ